jgi:YVTN family beta-propeller protein
VIDATTREVLAAVPVGIGPAGLVIGPSRDVLYVSHFGKRGVSVVDLTALRVTRVIRTKKQPLEMDVDATRGRLYVTNFESRSVSVIGTISGQVLGTIPVGTNPFGVSVDPIRNRVYVTNAASDTLSIIDGATCATLGEVPLGRGPLGIELDPRRDRAYVTIAGESRVAIVDTEAGASLGQIPTGSSPVGFGNFVGATTNSCAQPARICDDANPLTIDSCASDGTCRFAALAPPQAVLEGLAVLAGLIEEAPDTSTPKVIEQLGSFVTKARGQVTEPQAARKQFLKASRRMRKVMKTSKRAMKRDRMTCETALRLMDLAGGIENAARIAASPKAAGAVQAGEPADAARPAVRAHRITPPPTSAPPGD